MAAFLTDHAKEVMIEGILDELEKDGVLRVLRKVQDAVEWDGGIYRTVMSDDEWIGRCRRIPANIVQGMGQE